jgi:hypothetical protein
MDIQYSYKFVSRQGSIYRSETNIFPPPLLKMIFSNPSQCWWIRTILHWTQAKDTDFLYALCTLMG